MRYHVKFSLLAFSFILVFSCRQNIKVNNQEVIEKGDEIVSKVFTVLAKEVKQAINIGGVQHAIAYCNLQAIPLTDSLSNTQGSQIKRATDKPRNLNNLANQQEMKVLEEYRSQMKKNLGVSAIVKEIDGKKTYYSPIILNEFCLQCHGIPGKDIKAREMAVIQSKYPKDQATNYHAGDLRGVWVVQIDQ